VFLIIQPDYIITSLTQEKR